jgi:hypothetical protein
VTASISKPSSDGGSAVAGLNLPAVFGGFGPGAIGAASFVALVLMTLGFYQLRSRSEGDLRAQRDIGALSLDGAGRALALPNAGSVAAQPKAPPPVLGHPAATIGNAIPATREEALRILGMGVTVDVSETAIKKIVDGLRMSWHPDAATSAEDRELRELRIKQINAAWEIISGRRPV